MTFLSFYCSEDRVVTLVSHQLEEYDGTLAGACAQAIFADDAGGAGGTGAGSSAGAAGSAGSSPAESGGTAGQGGAGSDVDPLVCPPYELPHSYSCTYKERDGYQDYYREHWTLLGTCVIDEHCCHVVEHDDCGTGP